MQALRIGAAVAVVVAVAGGCTSSKPAARSTTTRPVVTTTKATAAPITAATGCVHDPVLHVENSYDGPPLPHGPNINFSLALLQSPVQDGRGDTITTAGARVEERRADGTTVVLVPPDPNGAVAFYGFADFDGDGRTDLLVEVYDGRNVYAGTWIVRGTIGPGRFQPSRVGVPVPKPHDVIGDSFAIVGDQNHDGAADLRFDRALYSGRALTAPGAGASLPAPFRILRATPVGLLSLGTGVPTFVLPDATNDTLEVLDARGDRLRLVPDDIPTGRNIGDGDLYGWSAGGHIVVGYGFGSRSGETEWRWNLDAPCV